MMPIAIHSIFNTMSLNIYDVDDNADWVLVGVNSSKPRKYRLYSNNKGQYFNFKTARYYLSDFIKMTY